jgi:hypothetical protein
MWKFIPELDKLYLATFKPKKKRNLESAAKEFVGKDIFVTPVFPIAEGVYKNQWVFVSNSMAYWILEQDLTFIKEVIEPLEEVEETTSN